MAIYGSECVRVVAIVGATFLLALPAANAADDPPASPPPAAAPKWPDCDSLKNTAAARPFVVDAYRLTPEVRKAAAMEPGVVPQEMRLRDVRLRDAVVIEIRNLDNLLRRRECASMSGPKKDIVLYLDERPLLEVVAHPPVDPLHSVMIFPLKRTEKSREVWTHLLGKPVFGTRKVAVSVGLEDEFGIPSNTYLDLEVVPRSLARWLIVGFLALAIAFVWLSLTTGLLRDTQSAVCANRRKSWSLSRVQAAWWFFVILMSYLFIGIITGDFSTTITGTTLVLLAISAGTTLSASVIDNSKNTPDQKKVEADAQKRVAQDIDHLENLPAESNQQDPERLAARRSQLKKLEGRNEHFFADILSDANGVNLHRFQNATWTLVLGGVFVCAVYRELAMPQFSETLLGLMGLSAGTFVAMKSTEAHTPSRDAVPSAARSQVLPPAAERADVGGVRDAE